MKTKFMEEDQVNKYIGFFNTYYPQKNITFNWDNKCFCIDRTEFDDTIDIHKVYFGWG